MNILVDTNILLRLVNYQDSQNGIAAAARDQLLADGHELFTTTQNLIEFWSVCTRPRSSNGFGLTVETTAKLFEAIELAFPRLSGAEDVFLKWLALVSRHSVSGRQVHDAHLVASMLTHGITQILTFNGKDFARYDEIEAIDPAAMA